MAGIRKHKIQQTTSLPISMWKRIEQLFKANPSLKERYGSPTAYIIQATINKLEHDEQAAGIMPVPKVKQHA